VVRSGTSIAANAEEAQDGQTKPDYITRMSVSRKESRETLYWRRLAVRVRVVTAAEIAWELQEAGELRAMIVAAIITAQSNQSRGRPQPSGPQPSALICVRMRTPASPPE
jgi:four helix bundle protein